MPRKRAGHTLMELTLVVALMAILTALAVPSMDGMSGEVKTRAAADAFRSALVTARAQAIDEGRPYSVAIIPGTGHYRIAPDGSSFWNGSASGDSTGTTPPLVQEAMLPGNIRFTSENGDEPTDDSPQPANDSVDPSQWSKQATFLPDGSALDDKTITFHMAGSRPLILNLRSLTGGVTVNYPESQSGQP